MREGVNGDVGCWLFLLSNLWSWHINHFLTFSTFCPGVCLVQRIQLIIVSSRFKITLPISCVYETSNICIPSFDWFLFSCSRKMHVFSCICTSPNSPNPNMVRLKRRRFASTNYILSSLHILSSYNPLQLELIHQPGSSIFQLHLP